MAEPSLGTSLGATEIGVLLATILYGVLNVQTYLYYQIGRENESLRTRILVPTVWFLETLHMFITWAWLYDVTVTHYGDVVYFSEAHWTLSSSAVFDGVIGALVQGFFAHRIYVLSGRWFLTIVSWVGSLFVVSFNFAISIISQTVSVTAFAQDFAWITTTTLVLLVAVDLLNTIALCWYLRVEKTGVRSTDSMLDKLFQWTIQTGMVTVFCAIVMLITSMTLSKTNIWISVSLFYAKLYSNCLLASLNGRETLRAVYTSGIHSRGLHSIQEGSDPLSFVTPSVILAGRISDVKPKGANDEANPPNPLHVYPPTRLSSAESSTKATLDP